MQVYEIRVLSNLSDASTILEAMYASDFAAIRAAQAIAGHKKLEVWRGLDCIYGKYCEAPIEERKKSPQSAYAAALGSGGG